IYVADQGNHRVQQFNTSTFAYVGQVGALGLGNGQFETVAGIAVDPNGNVWVTDNEPRVQEFSSTLSYVSSLSASCCFDDGDLYGAGAVATDPSNGNLWVGDQGQRVQEFDHGTFTHHQDFNDPHYAQPGSPGGVGGPAVLNGPVGLTYDSSGNLYVADYGNDRVLKLGPTGTILARAGANAGDGGESNVP